MEQGLLYEQLISLPSPLIIRYLNSLDSTNLQDYLSRPELKSYAPLYSEVPKLVLGEETTETQTSYFNSSPLIRLPLEFKELFLSQPLAEVSQPYQFIINDRLYLTLDVLILYWLIYLHEQTQGNTVSLSPEAKGQLAKGLQNVSVKEKVYLTLIPEIVRGNYDKVVGNNLNVSTLGQLFRYREGLRDKLRGLKGDWTGGNFFELALTEEIRGYS